MLAVPRFANFQELKATQTSLELELDSQPRSSRNPANSSLGFSVLHYPNRHNDTYLRVDSGHFAQGAKEEQISINDPKDHTTISRHGHFRFNIHEYGRHILQPAIHDFIRTPFSSTLFDTCIFFSALVVHLRENLATTKVESGLKAHSCCPCVDSCIYWRKNVE